MNSPLQEEEEIFDAARLISEGGARRSYLERACAGDMELRHRVERLLGAAHRAENFFAHGSVAVRNLSGELQASTHAANPQTLDEQAGTRIGNYKLLEKIGEGGGGVVYMAEQEQPVRRRVALKIIKLGMDTKSVIARFEAERQALALMDHPNIARVLDAGATETGRPYFVMELVRGFKLTTYCDDNQLGTHERLHLFIQICQAIQHAHQKGVIHRDIKPSNILVTLHDGVPVPKVIDFGIAKATSAPLTEKTLFTAYAQLIGTPAYMSPEQAEMSGLDVDTRADIYSLGVLLYELLTGRTPFDSKKLLESGFDEMRRTLREREPQRPSLLLTTMQNEDLTATAQHRHVEPPRLISQLRGDLDWIVMKALEKDRKRRYETANALAMDIQRYLNSEPILARPPSRMYRLQKLVHRNRVEFASITTILLVLLCGLTVSTWLFLREREARKRAVAAEHQEARLRQVAERGLQTEAELRRQAEARAKIIQAAVLIGRHEFAEADRLIEELPSTEGPLEGAAVFRTLGEWNAVQKRWAQASQRFNLLLRVAILEGWDYTALDYSRCAVVFVEEGHPERYEHFRRTITTQFRTTTDPLIAERTLKNALLRPPSPELLADLMPLYELARQSLETAVDNPDDWMIPWRCVSVGLMEYRRGRFLEAISQCERCLSFGTGNPARTATAQALLAMAHYQRGALKPAVLCRSQAEELITAHFAGDLDPGNGLEGYWFDWVLARVILREADRLLEGGLR